MAAQTDDIYRARSSHCCYVWKKNIQANCTQTFLLFLLLIIIFRVLLPLIILLLLSQQVAQQRRPLRTAFSSVSPSKHVTQESLLVVVQNTSLLNTPKMGREIFSLMLGIMFSSCWAVVHGYTSLMRLVSLHSAIEMGTLKPMGRFSGTLLVRTYYER